MSTLLLFLLALAVTRLSASLGYRAGLVDHPDARKRHNGAIPLTGGVAIFLGFLLDNLEDVTVEFLFWETTLPLWSLLVISAVTGVVVWELGSYLRRRRR